MATYVSISAPVALSTTAQIGYPAGITAGDTLLLCAQSDDTTIETTAPGFVPVTDALSGGGGTVRMWTRTVDGTESGTVAVTTPAGVRGVVTMAAYRPDSGLVMAPVADASAVDTDATSTAFSTTGPTLDVLTGDTLIFWSMFVATGGTFTGGASGITTSHPAAGTNASRTNGRSGGNLIQYNLRDRKFTADGSGAPTVTATGVGANASGPSNMVLFRDVSDVPAEPATGSATGTTAWTGAALGPAPRGFASVAEMLATPGFTVAHRGNSTMYAEGSRFAYDQAVARGYGALEVSLARTSDGVWFALHDQTLLRTSGVDIDPATLTWAQVQTYQITNAGDGIARPYMTWAELVGAYGSTHVFFVDPKHTDPDHRTEFFAMVDTDLGPTRAVIKYFGTNTSLGSAAQSAGYECWGYFYAAQIDGGSWSTQQAAWTMLGIEWNETPERYAIVTGEGKPVLGHVVTSQSGYNTAVSKGSDGVMVGGSDVVAAIGPAAGTATGATTWTGAASGSRSAVGTATGATGWVGAATGARPSSGAAVGSLTWSGTASGTRPSAGVGTGTATWTGSGTGAHQPTGSATGAAAWTGTASGASIRAGSATGAATWVGVASGYAPSVDGASGFGTGATAWQGAAAGVKTSAGVAVGHVTWTGTGAGVTQHAGTADGSTTWAGTAAGVSDLTTRDITITLTGPTAHPLRITGPVTRPLAVTGPTRHPLTVTGPRSA